MTAAVIAAVFLALVWVPRLWFWAGWNKSARTARTYRLNPTGERPDTLDDVGWDVSSVLSEIGNRRRQGLVVHRFREGDATSVAITVYGHPDPDRVAQGLADALHARATHDPELDLPTEGRVWYGRRYDYQGRDPNAHGEASVGRAAEFITDVLANADDNACLSVGIEPTRRWESRELRDWHWARSGRRDDTEGVGPGRDVRTHWVAFTDDETAGNQAVVGTPGQLHRWPFVLRGRLVTSLRTWGSTGAAFLAAPLITAKIDGLIAAGAALGLFVADHPAAELGFSAALVAALTGHGIVLIGGIVALALGVVAWRSPRWPNHAQRVWRRFHRNHHVVPMERPWALSPIRVFRYIIARFNPRDVNKNTEDKVTTHAYPYTVRTIGLNSFQVAQLMSFPGTSDTHSSRTEATNVDAPSDVVTAARNATLATGSIIADDPSGRPIAILDQDRQRGMFACGDQGSGKSYAVLRTWREDARARLTRERRNGQMSLVWFETKGEGANEAEEALARAGYSASQYVRMDALATQGPRLELLDRTDPKRAASRLVGAFTYAFETGSVGPRAAEAMRAAFTIALHMTPSIAADAGLGHRHPNVLWVGILLMGGDPGSGARGPLLDAVQRAADAELEAAGHAPLHTDATANINDALASGAPDAQHASSNTTAPLADAVRQWMYYERLDRRQFADLFESPRNKLAAIAQVDPLWTPSDDRPDVRLDQLIEWHGCAILNFGSTLEHGRLDQLVSNRIAAITLYLMWEEVKSSCHGWLAAGRSINLYADELSHISGTGSGSDVIGEMLDQGRAFGVQLCLATQRLGQLPQRTREAALSFGTRLYLRTENIHNAEEAAIDLNGGRDGAFAARDIRGLPVGVAAIRLHLHHASHAPFTAAIRHPLATSDDDAIRAHLAADTTATNTSSPPDNSTPPSRNGTTPNEQPVPVVRDT